jgi:hypothetical protein
MIKLKDPIVFGFISATIIYYILYLESKKNNDKKVPMKLPLIVGIIVWGSTSFFINEENSINSNSIPDINQEIYTNPPDF